MKEAHEIEKTEIRDKMTDQIIKAQETMSAALQEQTGQEELYKRRISDETLEMVHNTLDSMLRDKFGLEDGSRLSSLQSYQVGQVPLASLLDEFSQLMEQLDLQKRDNEIIDSLDKLWKDAYERS